MDLVVFLQSLATPFLSVLATIFDFLGNLPFFVILFSLLFLVYNKKFAYKLWLTYFAGFAIGSLALKNIIARPRPYQQNATLLATRSAYSYSLPSASATMVAHNATFFYAATRKSINYGWSKFLSIFGLIIICALTCLTQLYFAENFLLDVIVGVLIGFVFSILVLKVLKSKELNLKYFFYILAPTLLFVLLCFSPQLFTNNFANSAVFEFIGISLSIVFGCYIEDKFIKYQVKNNIIFTSFKVSITLIVLIVSYYASLLLPGIVIFSFLKYFVMGLIITIVLPLLFKKAEKFFYVFSSKVDTSKVERSSISLSEKQTKKIAQKIFATLKPGDVVLLSGDLGAGKSVLVRNILSTGGVNKSVTSPTFTLLNEYNTPYNHFYHFDMYRIEDDEEVVNIGFDEIIDDDKAIKFIEWPEKVETHLPKKYKKITIIKLGKKSRNIIVENYQA